MEILVCAGDRVIDRCNAVTVQPYLAAPNAKAVREKRTGVVVRVLLASYSDDSNRKSQGNDFRATYNERPTGGRKLVVVKRCDHKSGGLVRWTPKDTFRPGRFNPDLVPKARVAPAAALTFEKKFRTGRCCDIRRGYIPLRGDRRLALPADAPVVPEARFFVRIDPSKPWSAGNAKPVF